MNYYMMVSNCYPSYQTLSPATYVQPTQNIQQIIEVLQGALKKSIYQYSMIQAQNNSAQSQKPLQMVIKSQERPQKIITEIPKEELHALQQDFQKKHKKIVQENIVLSENGASKQTQNSSQHATEDQIRPQNVEIQNVIQTEQIASNLKKQKIRAKKSHFHVKVPQIDLVQTAYLSNLIIGQDELKKKREDLARRQVDFWNQKLKNRRDKREIRMLGN